MRLRRIFVSFVHLFAAISKDIVREFTVKSLSKTNKPYNDVIKGVER